MRKVTVLMAAAFVALAGTAFAQTNQILHVSGHSWETGGFPPSNPGDGLSVVGILNDIETIALFTALETPDEGARII